MADDFDFGGGMDDMDNGSDSGNTVAKNKEPTKISKDTLFRLMGGFNTTKDNQDPGIAFKTRYSENESISKIRSTYVRPETHDKLTSQSLISFVQPIHEEIAKTKFANNRFRVLAPEIEQASLILVSSILSPNDLQFTELTFDIETNKLNADTKEKICNMLAKYFNEFYDIGTKLNDWYKECLFKTGAQPVLVLPDTKYLEIKNRPISSTDISSFATNIGTESLHTALNEILNTPVYSGTENLKNDSDIFASMESLYKENKKQFTSEYTEPLMAATEELLSEYINNTFPLHPQMTASEKKLMQKARSEMYQDLTAAIEDTTIQVITRMKDGDTFRLTENPEILKFHQNYTLQRKYDLANKLKSKLRPDGYVPYKHEPITPVSVPEPNEGAKTRSYPTDMVLPTESVMPICIPGDKKQHIGYLVVLDQFGHPLVANEDEMDFSTCGSGYAAKAFSVLFGGTGTNSLYRIGDAAKANLASKVFEFVLDKYLRTKMDGLGIGDMDITQYNSIMQVMFRRLMYHKKTVLLFIPEAFMTYYAFQYRDNGTGKSKLEDIGFILHLRTTLFIAKIMGMMKDAVLHKTLSVELDPKVANAEGILQQVKDLYVAKNSMIFNANPADIVRTINDNSLSIKGKNIPGLNEFDVNVESNTGSNGSVVDDSILDTLNTLFIDFLDVPHSALNQLSENEYARSIVSNHLFFAKKIIAYQKIANQHNNKFIRTYIKYAKPLRQRIARIINKGGTNSEVVPTSTNGDAGKLTIDYIIDRITTKLPTPKIAPDKAQYAELNEYMDAVGGAIDHLLPDDVIPGIDSDTKDTIGLYRTYYKMKAAETLCEVLGIDNIFDIPRLDESIGAQLDISDIYQTVKNMRNHMLAAKSALDRYEDAEQNFQGQDDSMGDMGMSDMGGFGDDMGMDFGNDDFGDMGSMNDNDELSMGNNNSNNNEGPSSNNFGF